ncbi:hypothetical protein PGT21_001437 [Puccinia graminis f. sp. tritici]|uniref:Uncharacterized protein n=1 Tax=Puccinia graminis f. sp. tritici TaxID=56615 RepID=A0A5B0QEV1_PUCGR|nr:hypothetical protein PGT21_001437 [Puccinia graminis f. sp. tritici]
MRTTPYSLLLFSPLLFTQATRAPRRAAHLPTIHEDVPLLEDQIIIDPRSRTPSTKKSSGSIVSQDGSADDVPCRSLVSETGSPRSQEHAESGVKTKTALEEFLERKYHSQSSGRKELAGACSESSPESHENKAGSVISHQERLNRSSSHPSSPGNLQRISRAGLSLTRSYSSSALDHVSFQETRDDELGSSIRVQLDMILEEIIKKKSKGHLSLRLFHFLKHVPREESAMAMTSTIEKIFKLRANYLLVYNDEVKQTLDGLFENLRFSTYTLEMIDHISQSYLSPHGLLALFGPPLPSWEASERHSNFGPRLAHHFVHGFSNLLQLHCTEEQRDDFMSQVKMIDQAVQEIQKAVSQATAQTRHPSSHHGGQGFSA